MKKIILLFAFAGMIFGANAQKNVSSSFNVNKTVKFLNSSKGCDTLNPVLGDSLTVYGAQGGGFVLGNNSYGDLAKAQYFTYTGTGTEVTGAFFYLYGIQDGGNNSTVGFKVWNPLNDTTPGTELASASMALSDIAADTTGFIYVQFDPAGQISGNFIVGVILPQGNGDTLGIVSNQDGQATPPDVALEQWSDNSWHSIPGAWGGLSIAAAIFPIVCEPVEAEMMRETGIGIYPTLTNGKILFGGVKNATVEVYDITGNKVAEFNNVTHNINIANLNNGIYILKVSDNGKVLNKKIVLQK